MNFSPRNNTFFLNSNFAMVTKFAFLLFVNSESRNNGYLTLLQIPSNSVFIQNIVPSLIYTALVLALVYTEIILKVMTYRLTFLE